MASFREKWLEAVEKKNSVLCAGLDPPEYDMNRGEEGLPYLIDKREWSFRYLEAVSPFAAALKINFNYWKDRDDMRTAEYLADLASAVFGMVVIDDSKLADIGSANEAGIYYAKQKGFDAVTMAPFAGNMKEAAEHAQKWRIGLISMCLMSNPEYGAEKNNPKRVSLDEGYESKDIILIEGYPYVRKYIQLANDVKRYGLDGVVVGAPSKGNHISEDEIAKVRFYAGDETIILTPGVGKQGGDASILWKYFDKNNVIVNVGRALMFPKGSKSTTDDQAEAAKQYQEILNKLRDR